MEKEGKTGGKLSNAALALTGVVSLREPSCSFIVQSQLSFGSEDSVRINEGHYRHRRLKDDAEGGKPV